MAEGESNYGTTYPLESLKVIAESVGISNLTDEVAKELSDDVTYRLKFIFQDAMKFMVRARRTKLLPSDMDYLLKYRNVEPIYGVQSADHIPFRFASGGGRELHFIEDKEVELQHIGLNKVPANVPLNPTLHAHWLAIEGVQPSVPENPPPVNRTTLKVETICPKLKQLDMEKGGASPIGKPAKLRSAEMIQLRQLATHDLSVEQQLYFKEITEACVGSEEQRRTEALQSLSIDPGLYDMVPRFCNFIAEGVRINVVQNNLALLIYLMRMVKAMLDSPCLYLEKYLHEIVPSILTCIVTKQLCVRPETDNHWALRDFASRVMALTCKTYTSVTNNLQSRVTSIFSSALKKEDPSLPTLYGCIQGLYELAPANVSIFILPEVKSIGARLESILENAASSKIDKIDASQVKHQLLRVLVNYVKSVRHPPDILDEYRAEYGYLGTFLYGAVIRGRTSSTSASRISTSAAPSSDRSVRETQPVQQLKHSLSEAQSSRSIKRPASEPQPSQPSKYVLLESQQNLEANRQPASSSQLGQNISKETASSSQLIQNISKETASNSQLGQNISKLTASSLQLGQNISKLTASSLQLGENISKDTASSLQLSENISKETASSSQLIQNISTVTSTSHNAPSKDVVVITAGDNELEQSNNTHTEETGEIQIIDITDV